MRYAKLMVLATAVAGLSACDREEKTVASDLAFLDSLHLATVMQPDSAQTVSALEMGLVEAEEPVAEAAPEPAPAPKPAAAPRRRSSSSSSSASRSSGSSSEGTYSGGTVAREPRVVTKKNTVRDAAIGAAGGAVIGAVAGGSRNRVKGAVIGAAVGGVAGAVVGSTIDKSTRIEY